MDISRSCGTYEIKGYRLVVPVDAQKKLTERIIGYWQDGNRWSIQQRQRTSFQSDRLLQKV